MALHVSLQTVALSEGFVTEGTLVRSLPVVGPHVDRQVFLAGTRLPANAADEQFDAQVAPHVVGQVSLTFEKAAALRAAERRLVGVHAHVRLQLAVGYEAFAADDADERPLAAVRPHVSRQAAVRQEGLAADVAEVRPVSRRVDLLVRLQRAGKFETLPANLAAVTALPRVRGLVAG